MIDLCIVYPKADFCTRKSTALGHTIQILLWKYFHNQRSQIK